MADRRDIEGRRIGSGTPGYQNAEIAQAHDGSSVTREGSDVSAR